MSDEQTTGGVSPDGTSAREEGTALLRQGQFLEAAAALRRAVEAEPQDESAWRLLGGALASGGDPPGAVDAFQHAVEISPDSAKNHYNVAVALQGVGRIVEARASLAQALILDPGYQQAQARQQELNSLLPDDSGASAAPDAPPTSSYTAPSDSASTEQPVLRPVLDSPKSRVPPPPPPGGYAPPPPVQTGTYSPPSAGSYPPSAGGYGPPGAQGDRPYASDAPPPPAFGQQYGAMAPSVNGTTILVLGILGVVCFQILGPIAWIMANNALKTLDQYPYADQSQRGTVVAGRIMGIIGTVFLGLGVLYWIVIMIIAIAGGGK